MLRRAILGALGALSISSGALAAGPSIDEAPQFIVGTSTYNDVVAKMGKPASVTNQSDGTKIIVYFASSAHAKATSYVPVVGLFAGGAKGKLSVATFIFGTDGVLKSSSTTNASADCSAVLVGSSCR